MFGDSPACENMSASEVAEFINHHLGLIAACVEQAAPRQVHRRRHDGLLGRAGPGGQPSRVRLPRRPASAPLPPTTRIASSRRRCACASASTRGRSWSATSARLNRISYTIVGDAVNAAQRLDLGKDIDHEAEAIVWSAKPSPETCAG